MSDDIHVEPLRGLPEPLPAGERILWQGAPDWRALAVDVFHVRAVWIYGALLIAWRIVTIVHDGGSLAAAGIAIVWKHPGGKSDDLPRFWPSLLHAAPALCLPLVILGSLVFGLATPTEGSAIAVLVALLAGQYYTGLKWRMIFQSRCAP